MGIAERVYEVVKSLPEGEAKDVLEFAESKRAGLAEKGAGKGVSVALSVVSGKPQSLKIVNGIGSEVKKR